MFNDSLTADLKAVSDDRLKDFDNLSWLRWQETKAIEEWRPRLLWLRRLDRLAEASLFGDRAAEESLHECLSHLDEADAQRYADAIIKYHRLDLRIRDEREFEEMVAELGGTLFQMFPYLPPAAKLAIVPLGTLDQVFNILRDVYEDAARELCYFPESTLRRFGLETWRVEQLGSSACRDLLRDFFDHRLPRFRQAAEAFDDQTNLHRSLLAMRESCWLRYDRIEACYRHVNFDARVFHELYWREVRALS